MGLEDGIIEVLIPVNIPDFSAKSTPISILRA